MQTNVLEYLENTVDRVPDKTAFADEESALSFIQVSEQAKSIGTELSRQGAYREPVEKMSADDRRFFRSDLRGMLLCSDR